MINKFIFTVGLPGCGKSTYISEHFHNVRDHWEMSYGAINDDTLSNYQTYWDNHWMLYHNTPDDQGIIVSADILKSLMADYDPLNPQNVHEKSVRLAKAVIEQIADHAKLCTNVLLDGGGLNNHYNMDIIKYVKEKCPDCKIECIYFDTPIEVCIDRIGHRERKVPISDLYKKNMMIEGCLSRYRDVVNEFSTIKYFTNKHLFLDMDGTIVAYQKGKLDEDGNTDFVNSQLFLNAKPVQHVIDFARNNFDVSNIYIITAIANNIVLEEKLQWLDKYFPEFDKKHFLWVGNKEYKHVFLKHFAVRENMKMKDMTIIDDMHETLTKCLKIGMNAVHPSNIVSLKSEVSE